MIMLALEEERKFNIKNNENKKEKIADVKRVRRMAYPAYEWR